MSSRNPQGPSLAGGMFSAVRNLTDGAREAAENPSPNASPTEAAAAGRVSAPPPPPGGRSFLGGMMPPGVFMPPVPPPGSVPPPFGNLLPPGFLPPGFLPPGVTPPGFTPPGVVPPPFGNFLPPGFLPPGVTPPGFTPPGVVPPPFGNFLPPGFMPPGFMPPGFSPPGEIRPPGGRAFPPLDLPAGPIERRQAYTQLAQHAITVLRGSSREALLEATDRARAKQVPPDRLIDWIERKTRIGEVLGGPATGWSSDTVNDFAQAFQMQPGNTPVMDALAQLALLNWPDLEGELRQENTATPTAGDMLQNRRVVYQYPAPGTPLEPPYVVLVAVEHQDTRRAEEMVNMILGNLVVAGGFRMPREAAAKIA